MLAALEGAVPVGQLLLLRGATVDARNQHDETALSLAAQKGHLTFVRLLLEHGASTDCRPHGTPLVERLKHVSGLPTAQLAEILSVLGNQG